MRRTAAEVLGKIGDARPIEPLIAALKDKDWVRRSAAQVLISLYHRVGPDEGTKQRILLC